MWFRSLTRMVLEHWAPRSWERSWLGRGRWGWQTRRSMRWSAKLTGASIFENFLSHFSNKIYLTPKPPNPFIPQRQRWEAELCRVCPDLQLGIKDHQTRSKICSFVVAGQTENFDEWHCLYEDDDMMSTGKRTTKYIFNYSFLAFSSARSSLRHGAPAVTIREPTSWDFHSAQHQCHITRSKSLQHDQCN